MNNSFRNIKIAAFVIAYIIIIFRMINISAVEPGRGRNQIFGDGFSDVNTISSAWYFYDSGFVKTSLLPVHDYYTNTNNPVVYTHYPALPNILAGLYSVVFNTKSEVVLRIVPILLSVCLFMLIYAVLSLLITNASIAITGSCILVLSNYFIAWADNLHQHLYGELLKWLFIYLLFKYHESGRQSSVVLFILLLIMMIQVNISFEQPVYIGILSAGFAWVYQRKFVTKETVLLFTALIFGFLLHLIQNVNYFGSFQLAINDLFEAFRYRTTGNVSNLQPVSEEKFSLLKFYMIPFNWFNRMERYFLFPGWFILAIYMLSFKQIHAQQDKAIKLIWVFFAASVSWFIVMPQHAYIHTFTAKHFAVWYAIIAAYGLHFYLPRLKKDFVDRRGLRMAFHTILLVYCFVMFASQQIYELYLKFGLLYPHLGNF